MRFTLLILTALLLGVYTPAHAGIELANPSATDFSRDFTIATWVNVGNYYAEMPVLYNTTLPRETTLRLTFRD